jgi:hypothetical protein
LLEDLQTVAANLDPSLQPSSNDVGPLLGALVAYTEHGSAVVKAAESDNGPAAVSKLLSATPAHAAGARGSEK